MCAGDEGQAAADAGGLAPWRVGRKVGRTIYDANDVLIGMMDTPGLAAVVVAAVNAWVEREFTVSKIALPHIPDRVSTTGVRCNFCQVRLDVSRLGETCPKR